MIIGNGDIASVLNDRPNVIFFASGVSNSGCKDVMEFRREKNLMIDTFNKYYVPGISLFYFSTMSIAWLNTKYTVHKLSMELMVRGMWPDYTILRLGNITWGDNPNTFLNYIKRKHKVGEPVEIRDEWKYMINKDQLLALTDNLPAKGKNKLSVFGEMAKVKDLIYDSRYVERSFH